jgi:hypothetical protein
MSVLAASAAMAGWTLSAIAAPAASPASSTPERVPSSSTPGARATKPIETPVDAPDERPGRALGAVLPPADLHQSLSKAGESPTLIPNYYYYRTIAGGNFVPRESVTTMAYLNGTCVYLTGGSQLVAEAHLPDGAVPAYLRLYSYRVGSGTSTAWLSKYVPATGGITDMTSVSATATAGYGTDLSPLITGETIDNVNNGYTLIWSGAVSSTDNLCGARIAYTMPATGTFTPVIPCRVFDTRSTDPPNVSTSARAFQITGKCGVPAGATAVVGNFTVDQATAAGYIAFWQLGISWPLNSTLNYGAGQIVANSAVVPLDSTGQFQGRCYAGTVGVLFDVTGYYY